MLSVIDRFVTRKLPQLLYTGPEQPWPSGNALDLDERGPGLKAYRRPLVMLGRASGLKCSCQN